MFVSALKCFLVWIQKNGHPISSIIITWVFGHVDCEDIYWSKNSKFLIFVTWIRVKIHILFWMDPCLAILQVFWSCTTELSAAHTCWPFWLREWGISLPSLQVSVQYCNPHYSFATSKDKQVYFNSCFG